MRVITRRLQQSARRAGLPLKKGNLLNYINKNNNTANALLKTAASKTAALNRAALKTTGISSRSKYEKQENTADALAGQIQKFTKTGENSIFEKYREAEDKTELYKEAKGLMEKYNSLLSSLNANPDSLDIFYQQSMKDLVKENKDRLAEIGVTAGKDGKLQADTDKMKNASLEKLREVLGEKSDFLSKLKFLADKVADHANANIRSTSGNYSQRGNMNFYLQNRYDFRG